MDRLFAPPCKLLPELEQYRFWIWMQLVMIRLYVRTVKGEQANFLYGIAPNGRVVLVRISDTQAERDAALAKQKRQDQFKWEPSKAYRDALCEIETLTPLFRSPRRKPGSSAAGSARTALDTGVRRYERMWESVPPPDT